MREQQTKASFDRRSFFCGTSNCAPGPRERGAREMAAWCSGCGAAAGHAHRPPGPLVGSSAAPRRTGGAEGKPAVAAEASVWDSAAAVETGAGSSAETRRREVRNRSLPRSASPLGGRSGRSGRRGQLSNCKFRGHQRRETVGEIADGFKTAKFFDARGDSTSLNYIL